MWQLRTVSLGTIMDGASNVALISNFLVWCMCTCVISVCILLLYEHYSCMCVAAWVLLLHACYYGMQVIACFMRVAAYVLLLYAYIIATACVLLLAAAGSIATACVLVTADSTAAYMLLLHACYSCMCITTAYVLLLHEFFAVVDSIAASIIAACMLFLHVGYSPMNITTTASN